MIVTRRAATLLLGAATLRGERLRRHLPDILRHRVPPEVSRGWRVADVRVTVPDMPHRQRGQDPSPAAPTSSGAKTRPGDRRAQVAVIVETAARSGASGLRGARPVHARLTVTRFHALTFEAERRLSNAGVHNIDFMARSSMPAAARSSPAPRRSRPHCPPSRAGHGRGPRARARRRNRMITAHLAQTIAAWLGAGPDMRGTFSRSGN